MRRVPRAIAALAVAALAFAASTSAASKGATITVHPGESIQAAIDAASPGDTIDVLAGVYRENLTITKNDLTLEGAGPGATILKPPATATGACVDPSNPTVVDGICVLGQFDSSGNPSTPVDGTKISGFTVWGFSDFGVFMLNASNTTVARVEARHNGSYGISGFILSTVSFLQNRAHDNGDPGFYIGDSPNANAVVAGNTSYRNGVGGDEGFGFLFRDSSHGDVHGNRAWGNCAGFVFVDTGENPAPESDWTAERNYSNNNDAACPGGGGPPPTSGIGFLLGGTNGVKLRYNSVTGNNPTGPTFVSGGIAVVSTVTLGGAEPTDNLVAHNVATKNQAFDVFWDHTGSGNAFRDNQCQTSQPAGICGS